MTWECSTPNIGIACTPKKALRSWIAWNKSLARWFTPVGAEARPNIEAMLQLFLKRSPALLRWRLHLRQSDPQACRGLQNGCGQEVPTPTPNGVGACFSMQPCGHS